MKNTFHIPGGTYDRLPQNMRRKRFAENTIINTFGAHGYEEIETPMFEYLEVFCDRAGGPLQETMFKFVDSDGRIVALRPDLTTPTARMASTKLADTPLRLSYVGHAFRNNEAVYGVQLKEFTQAGIELYGEASPAADAEVIAVTIEALLAVGLSDFQIEIGQVGYFKGLLSLAHIDGEAAETLRAAIDCKDFAGVERAIADIAMPDALRKAICALPSLFGNGTILDAVDAPDDATAAALDNLRDVLRRLEELGLAQYVSVDLGLLQSLDYYTGVIFKGFTKHMGFHFCGGGRYDNLCAAFGRDMPATGVAIGIDRLLSALENAEKEGTL